jgi:NitT/TauT family transport system permease protein
MIKLPAIHRILENLAYPSALFVLSVVFWELGARLGWFPSYLLPAPTVIFERLIKTVGLLSHHAVVTSAEILLGFAIAVMVGVLLAVVIVFVRAVDRAIYPWLVFVQVIPKVALGPLLVVWLGFGFLPKVLMAFLLAFFPVMISAMIGFRSIEKDTFFLLRSMGAGQFKTLLYLRLPTALPVIFGSLKVAITLATVGAIVGEFIGANEGLGYVLVTANGVLDTALIFTALTWISALALLFYGAIALLERSFVRWHVSHRILTELSTG